MRDDWKAGMGRTLVLLALAAMAGCAQLPGSPEAQQAPMTAVEAVEQASKWAPQGVNGRFAFEVKGLGTNGTDSFIHSEPDYRNPRCLTLRVTPQVRAQLEARFKGKLDQVLVGRRVLVRGSAERVRIAFTENGRATGQYYYQTHVPVTRDEQITLL